MSWDNSYVNFGLVTIEGQNRLKIYRNRDNYIYLTVGNESVKDVRWTGNTLTVYLNNGKVRRYSDQNNYITI